MRQFLIFSAAVLLIGFTAFAREPQSPSGLDTKAAYARLRSLVGDWQAEAKTGKVHLHYELIAGGTALVERTTFDDNTPTMETIYHPDGDRLLLTHYCALGNQSRLQARSYNAETGELRFEFLDATNLASPSAGHVHNATIRFVDDNHFVARWEFFEEGKLKNAGNFEYVRVP
jgi:hypothetical protein